MAASYDAGVAELYQAPHGSFVAERKRLADGLKAAGDRTGAAALAKLGRPPISAWVVNQLWWHARDGFDPLLAAAARLRDGDLGAAAAHREALARLRARAAALLVGAGHGAAESTLRRVTQTLSAIAANGGFDPDPPGALAADRDPPGFEALIGAELPAAPPPKPRPAGGPAAGDAEAAAARTRREQADDQRRAELEQARARAEAAAERRRQDQEQARRLAERHRLEAALRTARGELDARVREVERLRKALASAEDHIEQARTVVADLEARLAEL